MEVRIVVSLLFCTLFQACGQNPAPQKEESTVAKTPTSLAPNINLNGSTIIERFQVPNGYERIASDSISFASYLRNLPLKEAGAKVKYFDGSTKHNNTIYEAVVDLPIGKRDLHQCADAVMRLRAEYFYTHKKYDSIHFNFTNGFKADYATWRGGKRIIVHGNDVSWKSTAQPSDSPKDFWKYLEMVFSYAGTASLSQELKPVPIREMRIGDVFIKGGFPGHAVIVVDMALDKISNEKVFLLAQSYMPAQEIQVLQNHNNDLLSPWYSVSAITNTLQTPEWVFKQNTLKRF